MSTSVHLVRHAAHDRLGRVLAGRLVGISISAEGRDQARALARRLRDERPAAIYSSPLERARETAEAIAEPLALPIETSEAITEIDFGEWAGATFEALAERPDWVAWNRERSAARPPGGETMREVQERVTSEIERLRRLWQDASIVLVSHGDVIKAALASYLSLSLDHLQGFEISPASLSTVEVGDWGGRVRRINEVASR